MKNIWTPLNEIFNINDYLSSLTLEKRKSLKDKFIYDLTFHEEVTSLASDLFFIFILKNQGTHKYIDIFISNFILKKSHDETHDICEHYFHKLKVKSIWLEKYEEKLEIVNTLESFFKNVNFYNYLEENIPSNKTINKKNKI